MIMLTGRGEVLAALRGYAAFGWFTTGMAKDVHGLADGDAVAWWGDTVLGRIGHALGPVPHEIISSLAQRMDWVNVPRAAQDAEGWDFRWTTTIPLVQPGQELVEPVDDGAAIDALLDIALPDSVVRPGRPIARRWVGIRSGGELVACAADRSGELAGVIGGVAVHPRHQGRGLGAAVSAHLTSELIGSHGLVCLGVIAGNDRATRLYERLGYRHVLRLVSVHRDHVPVLVRDQDPQRQVEQDLRAGQQAGQDENQPHQPRRHAEPAGQA